jgi:hypothetical protein
VIPFAAAPWSIRANTVSRRRSIAASSAVSASA